MRIELCRTQSVAWLRSAHRTGCGQVVAESAAARPPHPQFTPLSRQIVAWRSHCAGPMTTLQSLTQPTPEHSMNTAAHTFIVAIASVAAAAAIGVGLANRSAVPAGDVVKLERVVVVGKRAEPTVVAKLPRVVIEQRRTVPRDAVLAQAQVATWIA